jgi:capsular polysaccharide biosynthesis protein
VPRRTIILLSALVGLVALVGGLLGIASRSAEYEASAQILIQPLTEDPGLAISAADTLSRGPVASTFAEVYSGSRVIDAALDVANISEADQSEVSISTGLITDTSVVQITAQSGSPVLAERAANAVAAAKPDLGGYTRAFSPELNADATGTATRTGASGSTLAALAVILALVLALVTAAVLGRVFPEQEGVRKSRVVVGSTDARPAERRSVREKVVGARARRSP